MAVADKAVDKAATAPPDVWSSFLDTLNHPLFKFGGAELSAGSLATMLVALLILMAFSRWLRRWLVTKALAKSHIDPGTRETFATLIWYGVLALGISVILQAVGISLSSLTVIAGALGVGIGFGLQNIFSNFISGLIVMFERPIKIGDHINVAGAEGDVIAIGARATTLLTAQHTRVIVPNQSLITGNVVNWDIHSHTSSSIIPLKLSGDPDKNERVLLEALRSVPDVLQEPSPLIFVTGFDHAGYTMEIHFWLSGSAADRLEATNKVNRSLMTALVANEVALI